MVGLALAGACTYTAPPYADLTGTWQTRSSPSGRGLVMSLQMRGDSISGFGFELGLESAVTDSLKVAGHASGTSVWLAVRRTHGAPATFSGHILSSNQFAGTWSVPGAPSGQISLHRE
jgi:hypothetical protein